MWVYASLRFDRGVAGGVPYELYNDFIGLPK
jgi:hypothetical protein